ncbi:MAG TPA: glycoside hydrolase family 31 protein, partial [Aggregatilineales bacterium]|nr:glycoside hydrolase family 31 protein [Aggregatilineales bacterium]
MLPEQFIVTTQPIASHDAVVCVANARFTVLTEHIIRLEYHPDSRFEDRASQSIWYRQQPVPVFSVRHLDNAVEIETDHIRLHYAFTGKFTKDNLSIEIKATGAVWYPDSKDTANQKGTTRTLDFINGYTPLTDGFISRSGWALVDDTPSFVFTDDHWLTPRDGQGTDWYFLAYGHDYKAVLRDYCRISGDIPLVPRWILGNWWSRYWGYTQDELMTLITDFEAHDIPLSVCIVDMDWHLTETDNDSTGWTGYTWNPKLFPNPQGLISFFHNKGLKTALNLHPAEGIHSHESQYPEMARRMGINPETKKPVFFDITDPTFVKAYF